MNTNTIPVQKSLQNLLFELPKLPSISNSKITLLKEYAKIYKNSIRIICEKLLFIFQCKKPKWLLLLQFLNENM